MPFINPNTPVTPPTPLQQALNVLNGSGYQHQNNQRQLIMSLSTTWQNPKVTPQEIFAGLGKNALSACETSAAYVACVQAVNKANGLTDDPKLTALLEIIAGYTITPAQDGSVVVTKNS